MAAFHIHALAGLTIGLVAQGNPVGYPLAVLSHAPLDDLNSGNDIHWNHGYGTGTVRVLYIIFTVLMSLAVVVAAFFIPYALWYVVCACLPDFEHPVRLIKHKKGYWIHTLMSWKGFEGDWGIVMWVILATLAAIVVMR